MVRTKFPHFTPEEAEVLDEFIRKRIIVGEWKFDVRLPSNRAKEVDIKDPTLKLFWEKVTAKRIDALCETPESIHIIEVKRYMLASGIGQLLLYSYLYNKHFKPSKPIFLWLIAKYPDPDVIEWCKLHGIKTWTMF